MRQYPQALFDRVFRFERIDGRCATERYLHRWTLLRLPGGRALYLHHFVGSDWARDRHDHPKAFVSIGIRGGYVEEVQWLAGVWTILRRRQFRAPWIRRFPASHRHRLRVPPGGCWTLVYVGRTEREWGFWRGSVWFRWDRYVRMFGGRGGCG